MELLIDTHILIWFIIDDKRLPLKTRQIIENIENDCFISIASYWKIAIKHSLGRLYLNSGLENIFQIIEETGFEILPITVNQILNNARLEFHHKDPFDRIIIAQAISENLSIITKDEQFKEYKVPLIWEK
jgi:PIN domain nuclease of toxin-antitoxin system